MWLTSSSIGRKFVMALTGCCLVLFLTFHVLMNSVALIWPTAYNQICALLGANWYALIASMGLAALFIIHIIYAIWLTIQNRAARGTDRYAVTARQPQVEWSSKNMLVLGFVVVAFIAVHMIQFWSKMQLVEALHTDIANLPQVDGVPAGPALGSLFLQAAFKEIWTPIIYVLAFVALWFHMNHGFWSMLHTVGWNNNIWMNRLKTIGCWWTTIVVGLFIIQVGVFSYQAHQNYYLENEALQEQYAEFWVEQANATLEDWQEAATKFQASAEGAENMEELQSEFLSDNIPSYLARTQVIINGAKTHCSKIAMPAEIKQLEQFSGWLNMMNPNKGSVTESNE